ncbi:MAG: 4Fe-4S binding protein [Clostridium sp.]|uniref:ATP-binding protein n=1 Tax=Clostridium sp. TaxID=1506 RepID=UPI002A8E8359|nr:4Fe-4S binding protein [Clostridium sp.]MDY5097198.1 4Fe-4S binding protein [Clostridium sp.]
MIRQIIKIDESKCNGCGLCVTACHEGALGIIDGKAKLLRDDYCDGLGNCLPVCPTGALLFENREADAFDEEAVENNMKKAKAAEKEKLPCGCPGSQSKVLKKQTLTIGGGNLNSVNKAVSNNGVSELMQWPVQIKLVPVNAPYFDNCNLLIAADCTAYAYGDFHNKFMKNKVTIIGCPKLDEGNYAEKLTAIIKNNNIKSVTVVKMEVPCCTGILNSVKEALKNSGKIIPWSITTISTSGEIVEE